ncbi:MAG: hypothetical protein KIT16_04730 [Rhodospirillaceae bacterium]|nr:hypothetical protein [Rhodospirillaceae bacterium]
MKKAKKPAARKTSKKMEPRESIASVAARRFEDDTKRMLGTHYTNKHGVRRGR